MEWQFSGGVSPNDSKNPDTTLTLSFYYDNQYVGKLEAFRNSKSQAKSRIFRAFRKGWFDVVFDADRQQDGGDPEPNRQHSISVSKLEIYSVDKSVTCKPSTIEGSYAGQKDSGVVNLSWNKIANTSGYTLYDFNGNKIKDFSADLNTYVDKITNASQATKFNYSLERECDNGASGKSNVSVPKTVSICNSPSIKSITTSFSSDGKNLKMAWPNVKNFEYYRVYDYTAHKSLADIDQPQYVDKSIAPVKSGAQLKYYLRTYCKDNSKSEKVELNLIKP